MMMQGEARETSPSPQPTAAQAVPTPTVARPSPPKAASASATQINVPVSSLIADMQRAHKHRMGQLKDTAEANFKTASSSASIACQALVDVSNTEVIEIFNAETKIEAQIKEVSTQAEQLHKRMSQWAQLFVKFNRSLKEIGDVQHWTQMIEVDMEETVRILEALSAKKRQLVGKE